MQSFKTAKPDLTAILLEIVKEGVKQPFNQ
jgi:hypothetical protein